MNSRDATPERETVLLHGLPAHVEEALIERAAASGRDPADEAADIIERHVEESGDESI
jgi:hypothetical protein